MGTLRVAEGLLKSMMSTKSAYPMNNVGRIKIASPLRRRKNAPTNQMQKMLKKMTVTGP
jgi:hypothetical protein